MSPGTFSGRPRSLSSITAGFDHRRQTATAAAVTYFSARSYGIVHLLGVTYGSNARRLSVRRHISYLLRRYDGCGSRGSLESARANEPLLTLLTPKGNSCGMGRPYICSQPISVLGGLEAL